MKSTLLWSSLAAIAVLGVACATPLFQGPAHVDPHHYAVTKTDAAWRKQLSPEMYDVLRHSGTEHAFSSPLDHNFKAGVYYCAACGKALFSSDAKYDSGTGWPSFFKPISKNAVFTRKDDSLGMDRDEVVCPRCGSHLGHVFDDGPKPTGLRYCMNGVALTFKPGPTEPKKKP
jgi:peptide-methionine (R)-S-oxide reductase